PMGDLNDEYEAFQEWKPLEPDTFYIPGDGSSIFFELDKSSQPKAIVRTIGKAKQRGEWVKP
ncbi:MAG: hypothetical protein QOJ65_1279, partial [Fimbriimonadaceae bacterium]|nr:hypothetical protein [Fimbriimonadaceae bacterium]